MRALALALVLAIVSSPAVAGPTLAIWGDDGTGLSPELTTKTGVRFDVVVTLDSDGESVNGAEWVMDDLRNVFPGVYALATKKINDTPLDLGQNDLGEYLMVWSECEIAGNEIELVRITYLDQGGVIGSQSTVLSLRGFEAGDTQPSSFNNSPGIVDCGQEKYAAEMGGHENEGALCVNCYKPPPQDASMSDLKSKF